MALKNKDKKKSHLKPEVTTPKIEGFTGIEPMTLDLLSSKLNPQTDGNFKIAHNYCYLLYKDDLILPQSKK